MFDPIIFSRDVGIHCDTEWKANILLDYAGRQGYKWMNGRRFSSSYNKWSRFKEHTIYNIAGGRRMPTYNIDFMCRTAISFDEVIDLTMYVVKMIKEKIER
ncbi:MAG: hypothetical protein PF569_02380 [Candidatus Woesearchaeota archaeon]|jgi:hypothetical protein|nr:hypothetical protein [Candidatus Woesearchaeota archaeon]